MIVLIYIIIMILHILDALVADGIVLLSSLPLAPEVSTVTSSFGCFFASTFYNSGGQHELQVLL